MSKLLDLDDMALVTTGAATETLEEQFEKIANTAKEAKSLEGMYDELMQMVYTIDISGSMGDGLPPGDDELEAEIAEELTGLETDEELAEIAKQKRAAKIRLAASKANKRRFGIYGPTYVTKLQAVKDASMEFVNQRFDKFPNAEVSLVAFNNTAVTKACGKSRQATLDAISFLHTDGGTNIHGAVIHSMGLCKKSKKSIVHHIVLVSDGMDYSGQRVEELVPEMLTVGVIFDFILIRAENGREEEVDQTVEALKRTCAATGGEFSIVTNVKQFKKQFALASARLCLPPGK